MKKYNFALTTTTMLVGILALAGCATHDQTATAVPPRAPVYPKPVISQQAAQTTPGIAIAQISLPKVSDIDKLYLAPTGTQVGQTTIEYHKEAADSQKSFAQINNEVEQLYRTTVQSAQDYHSLIADVLARLQVGSTPGHPHLVHLRDQAQQKLSDISGSISSMNMITSNLQGLEIKLNDLRMKTQSALQISGAVEQDHANLFHLKDEVEKLATLIHRVMDITAVNSSRQQNWLSNERDHLSETSRSIDTGQLQSTNMAVLIATPFPVPTSIQPIPAIPLKPAAPVVPAPKPHVHVEKRPAPQPLPLAELDSIEDEIHTPEAHKPTEMRSEAAEPKTHSPHKPALIPAPAPRDTEVDEETAPLPLKTTESSTLKPLTKPLEKVEVKTPLPVKTVEAEPEKKEDVADTTPKSNSAVSGNSTPIAIVNFDNPRPAYKWYVYSAVNRSLETYPQAKFDVVVISPKKTSAEDSQKGKDVITTLTDMGINSSQFHLIETVDEKAEFPQVHIYMKDGSDASSTTYKFQYLSGPEDSKKVSLGE